MKIKTSELEGAALDWAVGIALKVAPKINHQGSVDITQYSAVHIIGIACPVLWCGAYGHGSVPFSPSTDWSRGGPILAQMIESGEWGCEPDRCGGVEVSNRDSDAVPYDCDWGKPCLIGSGTTVLIAACRAIVAAKLGDTVDVPEGLV